METKEVKQIQDVEVWKEVTLEDFKHYRISNKGRVWNSRTKIMLKNTSLDSYGYPVVSLSSNQKKKTMFIHRLVALAFIKNHENKPFVNHIDAVKTNNDVNNLEWVTNEENLKHASDTGLYTKSFLYEKDKEDVLSTCLSRLKSGDSLAQIGKSYGAFSNSIKYQLEKKYGKDYVSEIIQNKKDSSSKEYLVAIKKEGTEYLKMIYLGKTIQEIADYYSTSAPNIRAKLYKVFGKEYIKEKLKQNKKR